MRLLTPDICVIGAGSGGLSVAAGAAAFGVPVVLIERHRMGGDCLNTGCVPSKALIAAGRHAEAIRAARRFGIDAGEPRIDFAAVQDHVRETIAAIAPHDSQERFEGLGVTVLRETARFEDAATVIAGDCRIRARRFVIATGSSPAVPAIPGLDTIPYLTNESLFDLRALPARLAVIGGGPIGLEMAQAHRRLGSAVTVIEAGRALAREDADLARFALDRLRQEGVDLREGTAVAEVAVEAEGIVLGLSGGGRIGASHVLVAAGRRPNTAGLDLAAAGIDEGPAGIRVDRGLRTSNRRVHAIGDVADVAGLGPLRFTHVAGYHAGLVLRAILFRLPVAEDRAILPRVTYTDPEIGQVGLTEAEARARHGDGLRILVEPLSASDRARTDRAGEGMIKVITTKRGRILGAGVAAPEAGEIVNAWSLAVANRLGIGAFARAVPPYPILGEIGRRAAIGYYRPGLTSPWLRRIISLLRRFG